MNRKFFYSYFKIEEKNIWFIFVFKDIDWYALTALDLETENSKKNDPILLSARSTIYRENDTLVLEWNKNVETANDEEVWNFIL